jgi:hypothetical protein
MATTLSTENSLLRPALRGDQLTTDDLAQGWTWKNACRHSGQQYRVPRIYAYLSPMHGGREGAAATVRSSVSPLRDRKRKAVVYRPSGR